MGFEDGFGAVQGMGRDVQAEHLAFEGQQGAGVPLLLGDLDREGLRGLGGRPEEGVLAVGGVALEVDDRVDRLLVDHDQALAAVAEGVERAALASDSMTRLLQTLCGTLARKSLKPV